MVIKILGSGCSNCKKLFKATEEVVKELGVNAIVEKVEDFQKIMQYGIMKTPAIVIDENVKAYGRIPGKEEIKEYIRESV